MTAAESDLRAAIVAEARSWQGTAYHWHGRVKGAGVDCAMLLAEVYHATGGIPNPEVRHYSQQWHLHRDEEQYLAAIEKFARRIAGPPLPGDSAFFKLGRTYSHGAIVLQWPEVIHARINAGVILDQEPLKSLPRVFYSIF